MEKQEVHVMKEKFSEAEIEIIRFPEKDILTYSGELYDEDETPFNPIP